MRDVFTNQLSDIAEQLVVMAERVSKSMEEATQALLTPDLTQAEAVIEADQRIDRMQSQLDELSVRVLASQAPVATDLRVVVSALRISASLERMGDLAGHVAKLVRIRFPEQVVPDDLRNHVVEMTEIALRLSLKAAKVLETRELAILAEMQKEDDRLDDLHRDMFAVLDSLEGELNNARAADLTLLSRYLERYGDHALSVTKRVAFLVTGERTDASRDARDVPSAL